MKGFFLLGYLRFRGRFACRRICLLKEDINARGKVTRGGRKVLDQNRLIEQSPQSFDDKKNQCTKHSREQLGFSNVCLSVLEILSTSEALPQHQVKALHPVKALH